MCDSVKLGSLELSWLARERGPGPPKMKLHCTHAALS